MVSLQVGGQQKEDDKQEIVQSDQLPRSSSKAGKVLWFYSGAATAALIVLAILGGLYYQDVRSMCQAISNNIRETKTYTLNSKDGKNSDEVEVSKNTEIYYMRGANASQSGVMVADFTRNILGVYLKAIDQCFLAEHLDDKLPTPEEIQEMVDGGMDTDDNGDGTTIKWTEDESRQVASRYQMPYELHTMCWDKEIHWLKQDDGSESASRQKRATYRCSYVCYKWGGRWYCFYYNCRRIL